MTCLCESSPDVTDDSLKVDEKVTRDEALVGLGIDVDQNSLDADR